MDSFEALNRTVWVINSKNLGELTFILKHLRVSIASICNDFYIFRDNYL